MQQFLIVVWSLLRGVQKYHEVQRCIVRLIVLELIRIAGDAYGIVDTVM